MTKTETLKLFHKLEAIQTGHFLLTSGLHSDTYIQCARVLEQPRLLAGLVKQLAASWRRAKIDVVAGPAVGGIILAYELARFFKARAVYLERVDNKLTLRRGFTVKPNERVLAVEDVITTGGSVKEVIDVIKNTGGRVAGIASLVNRSGINQAKLFGLKLNSLVKITPPVYQPTECPLCREGKIPPVKPGSRGLK